MTRAMMLWLGVLMLATGAWATGLPAPFAHSKWITAGFAEDSLHRPCPVFRKYFLAGRKIRKATLQISALGLFEARLNGRRVGRDHFAPGWTNYRDRVQYLSYDVTGLLRAANELRVTVGEGWYRGPFRGPKPRDNYGQRCGLIACLRIVYADGSVSEVVTDGSWVYGTGPIRYAELYDGELQDTRWRVQDWSPAALLAGPVARLVPLEDEPVRQQERFRARRYWSNDVGERLVDFGQNLAGWVRLRVKGRRGDTVKVYHAEALDEKGHFYTGNLRTAKAVDTYILKGGEQVLEPHFTYHGFRFIRVWSTARLSFTGEAVALYSDLKKTGTFACSDPRLNRLQRNIEWSLNSNFLEVPTDCPQRSERLGWTGDAQVFAPTACFLRDTRKFYGKWLRDLASGQAEDGGIPATIPTMGPRVRSARGIAGWADAAVIIPWTLYQRYGDTAVLHRQYDSMQAWLGYCKAQAKNGLAQTTGYGDWLAPKGAETDGTLIAQAYWLHSVELTGRIARVLHRETEAVELDKQAAEIREVFRQKFARPDSLLLADTQTAYALTLAFKLLPGFEKVFAGRLAQLVRESGDQLRTGFLGTPLILAALSDNGYGDMAYRLLLQENMPSWLYPLSKGATTIWESWDGIGPDNRPGDKSLNHYAYGAVGNWLYENIAGIRCLSPGYRNVLIKPLIGGGLRWAKGAYLTDGGLIRSSWKRQGKDVAYLIAVPKGTVARLELPGLAARSVGAGYYHFKARW